ncbi:MAG: hypothetical protein ACI3Z9_00795 [Candidatus Onthomorpha sp.]
MSQIKQQIEQIIAKRKRSRLPLIESKIAFIESLLQRVNSLDTLIKEIKTQCEIKKGPYYSILASDPGMEIRLQNVSTDDTRAAITELQKELARLKTRFSRKSISLQVFGMAGSGKSTFIQSVTGLDNDVVLASEGGHCTGVSSFIYNSDHFEARVYLYTEEDMLALFNKNLEALEKKYNPAITPILLHKFDDIQGFKLENVGLPSTMDGRLSVLKYVENFSLISNLIFGRDAEGRPLAGLKQDADGRKYIEITDSTQVQQWVAQHNGHHKSDPNYVAYMNYLAVDRVDIYKKFLCEDAGDIVLMDNVGLGDASNDVSTEQHMYQAIADNSDAVILLYQPKPNSGWRGEEDSINSRLNNIRFKNVYQGIERMDVHELYFLLNERNTPGFDNSKDCPEVVKTFLAEPYERKETILIANAADKESTRKDAIEPILTQLMEYLDSIDVRMLENVNTLGKHLYTNYKILSDSVGKVISGSMRQGSNELKKFRELYKTDLTYSKELKVLDDHYYSEKDKPCPEVKEKIDEVINKLTKLIDRPDVIILDVEKGEKATNDLLEKYCNIFRNKIYAAFDEVTTGVLLPLQNRLKDSIINILFENARLGRIPLQNYAVEDGASQEWLKTFISEKVDKEAYPHMHHMFNFVLDYQISIEGLMEYNVARCLDTLDKHSPAFKTMSPLTGIPDAQQAKKIWSEIVSRTSAIQTEMRKWRDDFSLIPSHSFYARTSMFRDLLVDDTDTHMSEELYNFYSENRMAIWRDEFAGMLQEAEAFGSWNEESAAITNLCKKNSFIIKI